VLGQIAVTVTSPAVLPSLSWMWPPLTSQAGAQRVNPL